MQERQRYRLIGEHTSGESGKKGVWGLHISLRGGDNYAGIEAVGERQRRDGRSALQRR